MNFLLPAYRVV